MLDQFDGFEKGSHPYKELQQYYLESNVDVKKKILKRIMDNIIFKVQKQESKFLKKTLKKNQKHMEENPYVNSPKDQKNEKYKFIKLRSEQMTLAKSNLLPDLSREEQTQKQVHHCSDLDMSLTHEHKKISLVNSSSIKKSSMSQNRSGFRSNSKSSRHIKLPKIQSSDLVGYNTIIYI